MTFDLPDALVLLGAALLVVAAGLISRPAGLAVLGLVCIAGGLAFSRSQTSK